MFIQSFEVSNLRDLNRRTRAPLVQLIDAGGRPRDYAARGISTTDDELVTARGHNLDTAVAVRARRSP